MAKDDDYSLLLLHCDGADSGITFTDECGKTVTVGGNACTRTDQKMFGSASAHFDGAGDFLSVAGLVMGTGAFTIDHRFRMTTASKTPAHILISYGGSNTGFVIFVDSANKIGVYSGSQRIISATTLSVDTWYHVALVGNGGAAGSRTMKLYLDGVLVGTWTVDYNYTKTLYIGANEASTAECTLGYIDEVRWSNIQRWTADFTPPETEYVQVISALPARVTQDAIEVIVAPTTQKARLTQFAVEVIIKVGGTRVTMAQFI